MDNTLFFPDLTLFFLTNVFDQYPLRLQQGVGDQDQLVCPAKHPRAWPP